MVYIKKSQRKYFNKSKFFYGHQGEKLFEQMIPYCKKQSYIADYKVNDLQVEIGRSKNLGRDVIVYHRKLFYNIKKKYWKDLKKLSLEDSHKFICSCNWKEHFLVQPEKFIFIYFNHKLDKGVVFNYYDLLVSPLFKKNNGEGYFKVRPQSIYTIKDITEYINNISNHTPKNSNTLPNYIIPKEECKDIRKNGKKIDKKDYDIVDEMF